MDEAPSLCYELHRVQQPSDLGTDRYEPEFQAKCLAFNLKVTAAIDDGH